jgi:hypothetical protein
LKAKRQERGAPAVGKETKVANADEAFGKQMQQEAAQELGMQFAVSSVPRPLLLRCHWLRGLRLDMSRIHPECPDSDPSDRSVAADVLLRQEPDEEEDEEEDEGDGKKNDDDADEDDGYSE